MKILILGNCQAVSLANRIPSMTTDLEVEFVRLLPAMLPGLHAGKLSISGLETRRSNVPALVEESNLILLQNGFELAGLFKTEFPRAASKVRYFPRITFTAFHPDMIFLGKAPSGPTATYHSSIASYAWTHGLGVDQTIGLFREDVFEALGFFDYWDSSIRFLTEAGEAAGLPMARLIGRWREKGVWMYTFNHPKLYVLADIARAILAPEGIPFAPEVEDLANDPLAGGPVWGVYPEIARRLGVEGGYHFKPAGRQALRDAPIKVLDLEGFVRASFRDYANLRNEDLASARIASSGYQRLKGFVKTRPGRAVERVISAAGGAGVAAKAGRNNPYDGLADYQFWRRALERLPMGEVDPVVRARFTLERDDKVATAGSCFAQHISRTLVKQGFNYYVAERGDALAQEEAERRNYGVFSARYGNLYTTRQLVQLFDRAYGRFTPVEDIWVRSDGRLVDPFRPQIEPDGFATPEELERSRTEHFAAVREMFERLDVMVFTFGLTEAWRSRVDGAVYPLAPGVVGGEYDPQKHEFVNFAAAEVTADMQGFVHRLLRVNPGARMILTVSPVPLIATYEDRHVLVSTTYSKSALRVAAEEISQRNPMCAYFPSYEIIIGNYTRSEYYESDLRSVKPQGVEHVMRLFLAHYSSQAGGSPLDRELARENAEVAEVVCDEEAIDA